MNHILSALSDEGRKVLLPLLKPTALKARQRLELPNTEIRSVYFLETGIAAVQAISGRDGIATGLIGCEGASGVSLFLGDTQTPNITTMITDGHGLVAEAKDICGALTHTEVRRLLCRYALAYFNQAEHTAYSNALTSVRQRVVRWVLMAHDRVPSDVIPMTHETMAFMIGTRRAGVTGALRKLEADGMIELSRGEVRVLDRRRLEALAGHFYGLPEKEFVRLVGTFWPPLPKEKVELILPKPAMP